MTYRLDESFSLDKTTGFFFEQIRIEKNQSERNFALFIQLNQIECGYSMLHFALHRMLEKQREKCITKLNVLIKKKRRHII